MSIACLKQITNFLTEHLLARMIWDFMDLSLHSPEAVFSTRSVIAKKFKILEIK